MEIKEIIAHQRLFDATHRGRFNWDQPVSADSLTMLEYLTLALSGESGEVANCVKKVIRGDVSYQDYKEEIIKEITDVFIYVIKFAYQMDFDLEEAYLKKTEENRVRFKSFENE